METKYSVEDVVLMSGLSERTVRTHMAAGFLAGKKVDGKWCFSEEQLSAFFEHPAVQPGIHAKKNALVYDFMAAKPSPGRRMCVLLDLGPEENAAVVTGAACRAVNQAEPAAPLRFAMEQQGRGTRLILTGAAADVTAVLEALPRET